MAEKGKQSNILWIALIGGAIYYFWKKKKERDAQLRALSQQSGGQEVGGGGGGGFGGGGGITPLTPVITGQPQGEDTSINVNVETPAPPSAIDCIKFPNTAGCNNTITQAVDPKVVAEPSFANPSGMGGGTAGGGISGGGISGGGISGGGISGGGGASTNISTPPKATTSPIKSNFRGTLNMGQKKAWDFDGDFDYMDKEYNKTDFDGEL